MKFLVCVLLALAAANAEKKVCEPGSRFKVDCNTCRCSPDGTLMACTRMECPKVPEDLLNADGSPKLLRTRRSEKVCEPGSQFKEDCNSCICSHDGTEKGCTKMKCPQIPKEYLNEDGSSKLPHEIHNNPLLRTRRSEKVCEPGSRFKEDCNSCFCSPDGTQKACTRMECPQVPKEYLNEDGSPKLPHQIHNNPLLRTRRGVQVCVPGKPFKRDCNHCMCNRDGTLAACTQMMCLPDLSANPEKRLKRQTQKNWGPLYIHGQPCVPKSFFYSECNGCVCEADGRSAACTLKFCLP